MLKCSFSSATVRDRLVVVFSTGTVVQSLTGSSGSTRIFSKSVASSNSGSKSPIIALYIFFCKE